MAAQIIDGRNRVGPLFDLHQHDRNLLGQFGGSSIARSIKAHVLVVTDSDV